MLYYKECMKPITSVVIHCFIVLLGWNYSENTFSHFCQGPPGTLIIFIIFQYEKHTLSVTPVCGVSPLY